MSTKYPLVSPCVLTHTYTYINNCSKDSFFKKERYVEEDLGASIEGKYGCWVLSMAFWDDSIPSSETEDPGDGAAIGGRVTVYVCAVDMLTFRQRVGWTPGSEMETRVGIADGPANYGEEIKTDAKLSILPSPRVRASSR